MAISDMSLVLIILGESWEACTAARWGVRPIAPAQSSLHAHLGRFILSFSYPSHGRNQFPTHLATPECIEIDRWNLSCCSAGVVRDQEEKTGNDNVKTQAIQEIDVNNLD